MKVRFRPMQWPVPHQAPRHPGQNSTIISHPCNSRKIPACQTRYKSQKVDIVVVMGRQVYRTCYISCPDCRGLREKMSESIKRPIHTSFFIHIRARKKLIPLEMREFWEKYVISPPQGLLQSESSDYLTRWSYSNEMWSAHKSHGSSRVST